MLISSSISNEAAVDVEDCWFVMRCDGFCLFGLVGFSNDFSPLIPEPNSRISSSSCYRSMASCIETPVCLGGVANRWVGCIVSSLGGVASPPFSISNSFVSSTSISCLLSLFFSLEFMFYSASMDSGMTVSSQPVGIGFAVSSKSVSFNSLTYSFTS
jgi:hypothetical protein